MRQQIIGYKRPKPAMQNFLLILVLFVLFPAPTQAAPVCAYCKSSEAVVPIHYIIDGAGCGMWKTVDKGNQVEIHVFTGGVDPSTWLKVQHEQWYCKKCKLRLCEDKSDPKSTIHEIDFGHYVAQVQNKLMHSWQYRGSGPVVAFRIYRDGHICDLRLTRSSGNEQFDKDGLNIVNDNAPYPPLPEGGPESVELQFTFQPNNH